MRLQTGKAAKPEVAEAARLACRVLIETVSSERAASVATAGAWLDALHRADERVCADRDAGYTTLIGFALAGGHVVGAANGDSALWLASPDAGVSRPDGASGQEPADRIGLRKSYAVRCQAACVVDSAGNVRWRLESRGPARVAELLRMHRGQALLDSLLAEARLPWSGGLGDDFTAVIFEA